MKRANDDIAATDIIDDDDDERIATINAYAPRETKWARDWRQVLRSDAQNRSNKIKHVQMDELMELIEHDLLDADSYQTANRQMSLRD